MSYSFVPSLLAEAMSRFICVLPLLIILHFLWNKNRKIPKLTFPHVMGIYVFCLYLIIIFSITGIPMITELTLDMGMNFIPFIDIKYQTNQYTLNLFIFVPFGFLLPLLWSRFEKKHLTFLSGLLFSLFIEIMQIFSLRVTDIDDLIMNTIGTIVGYYVYVLIKKIIPKVTVFCIDDTDCLKYEIHFYIAISWLAIFIIPPFLFDIIP